MDYYELLGVSRNASEKEIKTAFRKKAATQHPDKGGDHKLFTQLNEAYQTLSNPEKKRMYDQYGTSDPQQAHARGHGGSSFHFNASDMEDIFGSFFGHRSPFGQRQMRNQDITLAADIDIEDIVFGKDFLITYRLPSGKEQSVNVTLPSGVRPGDKIRYSGMGGDQIPNAPRGDLFVIVRVRRHPRYTVDGINLYVDERVNVFDLMIGSSIYLRTIQGKEVSLKIPPGTNSGTTFSMHGQGLPDRRTGQTGNLFVKIYGDTPKIQDTKIIEQLRKIKNETDNLS